MFEGQEFTEDSFKVRTIIPEKTLLEKMILMHEEFHKEEEKVRHIRMSRHLYDIMKIHQSEYGERAMRDSGLFRRICNHRSVFTPVQRINYEKLEVFDLLFIPPETLLKKYRADYLAMRK